jgi:hypothetical protein
LSVTSASSSANKAATATCSGGKKVLGGGGDTNSVDVAVRTSATDTTVTANGYEVNNTNGNWTVTAWAICATVD